MFFEVEHTRWMRVGHLLLESRGQKQFWRRDGGIVENILEASCPVTGHKGLELRKSVVDSIIYFTPNPLVSRNYNSPTYKQNLKQHVYRSTFPNGLQVLERARP